MQGNGKDIPSAAAACIDAETLAAWADGGLPKADAALVEEHLADCDRCTAMLATFARITPPPQVPESLWTRWHLRWLVPVATAATVAALWVLVPSPRPIGETAMTSTPTAEPPAPATADSAQPASPTESKEQEALRAPEPLADERKDAFSAAPQPPQERDRTESRTADAQPELFAPPVTSASPAPPAAAPSAAPPSAANTESAARSRTFGSGIQAAAPRALSASILEVVSPDPMIRWRVVGAGQVERTTNGGTQWERATLPESATLTGGSSPASSICWLVGRSGVVYVTTDGLRFTKVPFPDRVDFVSIQAIDARRATVVTIEGGTMRTDDQGANWIRITP